MDYPEELENFEAKNTDPFNNSMETPRQRLRRLKSLVAG
jgi:hypothetical protein